MKDTFYFSHDYNTRQDEKIRSLIRRHGMEGYGIFWAIIEDLYNNANRLKSDIEGIAYDLRVKEETVKSIIYDFGLFVFEGAYFGSLSAQARIEERDKKSTLARDNAFKRWNKKASETDANALKNYATALKTDANAYQTECEGSAIKERKGKKEKIVKDKKEIVLPFQSESFVNIWNEWKEYKKNQHSFIFKSAQSEQSSLINLAEISGGNEQTAIKIIKQSFINGWKGLFPLKTENNGNTTSQSRVTHVTNEQLHESLTQRFGGR